MVGNSGIYIQARPVLRTSFVLSNKKDGNGEIMKVTSLALLLLFAAAKFASGQTANDEQKVIDLSRSTWRNTKAG